MDWAEKYRPSTLEDVIGNTTAVRQVLMWAREWSPARPPLLLYGKPGTGKTSAAHALARDMGWASLELNASDQRTRAVIERIAGAGSTSRNLSGAPHTLVILDEADNLHGTADHGGARAILDVIRNARQPVILIANDIYELPGEIRSACEQVQFRALPARSIAPALRRICASEGISCSDDAIRRIAEAAGGDMRSAITMLYAASVGKVGVSGEDVHTSSKDQRSTIFMLVSSIFAGGRAGELLRTGRELDETPDTVIQWIEASLPLMERETRIRSAYRWLTRADCYLGNTFRLQHYTLWRYAQALMILGVAAEAEGTGIRARILPPGRWKRMAAGRKQKTLRMQAISRIAQRNAISIRTLHELYLGPIALLVDLAPEEFARDYGMDADELDIFLHDRSRAVSAYRSVQPAKPQTSRATKRPPRKKAMPGDQEDQGTQPVPLAHSPPLPEPREKEDTADAERKGGEKTEKGHQKTLFEEFSA